MRTTAFLPVLVLAATVVACDGTGTSPNGRANATFRLSQVGGGGAAASLIALDDRDGGGEHHGRRGLALSDIKSILIRFTGVAALPILETDTAGEIQWVTFHAAHPDEVNLLALPTDTAHALILQRGNLPSGTYGHLRLLFDQASITFANTVTLEKDDESTRTFFADSTYPLFIGGFPNDTIMTAKDADDANHFGIFLPHMTLTVGQDTASTVDLVFDPGATVKRVFVTGKGIRLIPVIRTIVHHEDDEENEEHEGDHGGSNHGGSGHGGAGGDKD